MFAVLIGKDLDKVGSVHSVVLGPYKTREQANTEALEWLDKNAVIDDEPDWLEFDERPNTIAAQTSDGTQLLIVPLPVIPNLREFQKKMAV
jgi:hypothetical protein